MSFVFPERPRPPEWREFKARAKHPLLWPFFCLTWMADWAAHSLAKWPMVELLEYLGSFSILFAAIFYFAGAPDRLKQKHYQAWQVINTAQGKSGNGGRIDALQELNADHVALVAVDLSGGAYLQGLALPMAKAHRANFSGSDLRGADLHRSELTDAEFVYANLRGANLTGCDLRGANFTSADLTGANLSQANLEGANLADVELGEANLAGVEKWQSVTSLSNANVMVATNLPAGFLEWAKKMGARTKP